MATEQHSLTTNDGFLEKTVWLVVEDDAAIRQMMCVMISFWRHIPLVFADGFQAMAWLDSVDQGRAEPPLPELAILDLHMPGPQGDEIAQRMRQSEQTSQIPIVMITAFFFDSDKRKTSDKAACPDIFMSKPLPAPDQLRKLFEDLVRAKRDAREKAAAPASSQNGGPPPEPPKDIADPAVGS